MLLKGLEKNPGSYDILVSLGMYYKDRGKKKKPKKSFEEILKPAPATQAIIRELEKLQ